MALFEVTVLALAVLLFLLVRLIDKSAGRKFLWFAAGALLFEYFTQALWLNQDLAWWAYLYLDVSWVLTIGWATILLVCTTLINEYFPKLPALHRFFYEIVLISFVAFLAESVLVVLGVRDYSSAVISYVGGSSLGVLPAEALYYIPSFIILVLSFARYWERVVPGDAA